MATRRMFSIRLINSARFLRMPISSQALYFHLGLHADDDGIVEAYSVIRSVGCTEDDLRVLVSKGFIRVLNDDLVSFITDWSEHNKIRADRKIDSMYKDLLLELVPDVQLLEKRQRADVKRTAIGQPMDNQWTAQDRLGKDRLGKDRLGKDNNKPVKHKHGEYKNVLLTDEELEKLKAEYPDYSDRIENLSNYLASSGKTYKSHYATIRNWARKEKAQPKVNKVARELDESYDMMAKWAKEDNDG